MIWIIIILLLVVIALVVILYKAMIEFRKMHQKQERMILSAVEMLTEVTRENWCFDDNGIVARGVRDE